MNGSGATDHGGMKEAAATAASSSSAVVVNKSRQEEPAPASGDVVDRKAVPGTTLKCLEATAGASAPAAAGPKKPSYRVLEDPSMITSVVMPQSSAASAAAAGKPAAAKRPTYKVLEDPMLASMYEPSSRVLDSGAKATK